MGQSLLDLSTCSSNMWTAHVPSIPSPTNKEKERRARRTERQDLYGMVTILVGISDSDAVYSYNLHILEIIKYMRK